MTRHLRAALPPGRLPAALAAGAALSLLEAALVAPLAALLLRLALERRGGSVGNFEIIAFLLSPPGLLGAFAVGAVQATAALLRFGLLLLLVHRPERLARTAARLGRRLPSLAGLGAFAAGAAVAAALVAAAWLALAFALFWRGRDLNGLVVDRPAAFWEGVAFALAGLLPLAAALAALLLRLSLAPALVLFDGVSPAASLRESWRRLRGRRLAAAWPLAAWAAAVTTAGAAGPALLGAAAPILLGVVPGPWELPLTGALFGLQAAWLFAATSAGGVALAALQHRLWLDTGGVAEPFAPEVSRGVRPFLLGAAALAAVGGAAAWGVLATAPPEGEAAVVAHRCGAARAPENTLAALRRCVADGADEAEIDVQLSRDGVPVVLHDADLLRVGGVPLRVAQTNWAELYEVDVGRRFGAEFAGERLATLDDFCREAAGRVGLLVELKPPRGGEAELVAACVRSLRAAPPGLRARLCSQSLPALAEAARLAPEVPRGYVAGAALGDPTRLPVDFLMLESRQLTPARGLSARVAGLGLLAWTVDDPAAVAPLIDAGATGFITDDVPAVRARLRELSALDPAERLLLRARHALGR